MIGIAGTVPLNGGRGRATPQCVWSIHRIDAQLGRYLDINSAWRDPQEQEQLYTAYRSYVNGNGPWAPIALPPEQSVHCKGEAIDTDDNNAAMTRILNDNGWFHTVFRNGVLVEPWHYEYDYRRDNYYGSIPASDGSTPLPTNPPKPLEWDEMATKDEIKAAVAEVVGARPASVIIKYEGGGARNGIYFAAPGFLHHFTGEEWTQFNAHGLNSGIKMVTPVNDRDFDVFVAIYTNNDSPAHAALPGAVATAVIGGHIQAQDANGNFLVKDGKPVTYPLSGYVASTNAQVSAIRTAPK